MLALGVVVDRRLAVRDVDLQRRPLLIQVTKGVAERRLQQRAGREPLADLNEPCKQRDRASLTRGVTQFRRGVGGVALDFVELLDEREDGA